MNFDYCPYICSSNVYLLFCFAIACCTTSISNSSIRAICSTFSPNNSQQSDKDSVQPESEMIGVESLSALENVRKKAKLEVVLNLVKLGLTAEQIAQSLNLSLDDVEQFISNESEV